MRGTNWLITTLLVYELLLWRRPFLVTEEARRLHWWLLAGSETGATVGVPCTVTIQGGRKLQDMEKQKSLYQR